MSKNLGSLRYCVFKEVVQNLPVEVVTPGEGAANIMIVINNVICYSNNGYTFFVDDDNIIRGRTGTVVRASDFGPRSPWFEPQLVCCSLWPLAGHISPLLSTG